MAGKDPTPADGFDRASRAGSCRDFPQGLGGSHPAGGGSRRAAQVVAVALQSVAEGRSSTRSSLCTE
jgi:hypothetical protein